MTQYCSPKTTSHTWFEKEVFKFKNVLKQRDVDSIWAPLISTFWGFLCLNYQAGTTKSVDQQVLSWCFSTIWEKRNIWTRSRGQKIDSDRFRSRWTRCRTGCQSSTCGSRPWRHYLQIQTRDWWHLVALKFTSSTTNTSEWPQQERLSIFSLSHPLCSSE